MRAATYLRVSRSDQRSAMQDDETRELVKRRGWQHVKTYADEGLSGATGQRPALRELLADARRRAFDVLVVYRSDRLFRSLRELLATLETLGELGIAFVSVHEPFDTTTSAGKLLLQIVGAFAEFERNVLRERTRSGLEAAKLRGRQLGRPKRTVDAELVAKMRKTMTMDEISRELGVGVATLYRLSRRAAVDA